METSINLLCTPVKFRLSEDHLAPSVFTQSVPALLNPEMLLNIQLAIIFLNDCLWAIADVFPTKVPFVINEPFGPNSNGPLHLEMLKNMDSDEKAVQLNLEWQYESSTVKNDIRNINRTQIENYASLRLVFETYNHDGWVIFG